MSHDGKQKRRGGKSGQGTKPRTSALLREARPNAPLSLLRQPGINDGKRASCMAAAAEFADALEHDRAELRKSGSKLEEIVHLLNTGTDPASIRNIIESAVDEFRLTLAKGKETLDGLKELFATAEVAPGPER